MPLPDAKTIRCACPHCQAVIKAPAKAAGTRASCPRCGLKVEIPVLKAEPIQVVNIDGSLAPLAALVPVVSPQPASVAPMAPQLTSVLPPAAPLVLSRWFVWGTAADNTTKANGPFTLLELQHFVQEGRIVAGDLMCSEGSQDWVPAESVRGLALQPVQPLRTPPSPPPVVVNIVNTNNNVAAQPAPVPRKAGKVRKTKGHGGLIARLIIYPLLFIFIVSFAWRLINDGGTPVNIPIPAMLKKSPQDQIVGKWEVMGPSKNKPALFVFYKDGEGELIIDRPARFTYRFVDDNHVDLFENGTRDRVEITFPSLDELILSRPNEPQLRCKRVK